MEPIKEVMFERLLNASPDQVWKAWTDPNLLKQWWGPDNVTIPECEIDPRVGGRLYIVMLAGEGMGPVAGTRWPMEGTFTVLEPEKAMSYTAKAWTEGHEETTTIETVSEMTLLEVDDKTKMHLRAAIVRTGPDAQMAAEGMQYGYTQQFEKLDRFLAQQ